MTGTLLSLTDRQLRVLGETAGPKKGPPGRRNWARGSVADCESLQHKGLLASDPDNCQNVLTPAGEHVVPLLKETP